MNNSWSSLLRSLTLPQGAKGATPRIVIGPDIPAELRAWSPPNPNVTVTWYAAELYYSDATHYAFTALVRVTLAPGVFTYVSLYQGFYNAGEVTLFQRFDPSLTGGIQVYDSLVNGKSTSMTLNGLQNPLNPLDDTLNGMFAINPYVDFRIDSTSQGRGVYQVLSSAAYPALLFWCDPTEVTLISNIPGPAAGRCFAYELHGGVLTTGGWMQARLQTANPGAGTIMAEYHKWPQFSDVQHVNACVYIRNTGIQNRTASSVFLTVSTSAGLSRFFASAPSPFLVVVRDVGAATDWPDVYDWHNP